MTENSETLLSKKGVVLALSAFLRSILPSVHLE